MTKGVEKVSLKQLPKFPYGAVYFRKSNPPQEDWERDYKTAAEDANNIFRHWFLWSAIEVAPGKFDWSEYDRQLDLAAKHGMKTIIAEMTTAAPEWAFRQYAHARFETRDGRKVSSHMGVSCVTGGFPGLCLDNDDFKEIAENWLRELVTRYKDHPGLGGYDIWNEVNYGRELCYCEGTMVKFREWLKNKYGSLQKLGEAWYRHSYATWEDIQAPREVAPYPDTLDWLQFRLENAERLMQWRAEIIREIDPNCAITAHGIAMSLGNLAPGGSDDWRWANHVEVYGYTWGASRHGNEPWKQYHAVDLVRSATRGKPFWHAEAYGGPLWMQPQLPNRPREDGRIPIPEDIRLWHMVSMAAGATGFMFLRWRPLLDGPLFGAFGPYGMDGSRTDRSEMSTKIARWVQAPEQQALWKSRPVQGDVGILFVPESQMYIYAQQNSTEYYAESMRGAYQAFFDNNIQADWVHIDDIDKYTFLYLPIPVALNKSTAEKLKAWVAKGGTLISEGCPAYFGDRGRVGVHQPNFGLDEMFGAVQSYVEFTPDLLPKLQINMSGYPVRGGLFLQKYEVTHGTPVGWYEDGSVAAVEAPYGEGKTMLIGTFPGSGYFNERTAGSKAFFASLLDWAGVTQLVECSEPRLTARIHAGEGGTYLWVTNPTHNALPARLRLSQQVGTFSNLRLLWGQHQPTLAGEVVDVLVGGLDAAVIRLE